MGIARRETALAQLFWLSDKAWALVERHLPRGKPGRPRVDDRRVISGILHRFREGCRWRALPPEYGPYTTCLQPLEPLEPARPLASYLCRPRRLRRSAARVTLIDSSGVKAHRSAAGAEKGVPR